MHYILTFIVSFRKNNSDFFVLLQVCQGQYSWYKPHHRIVITHISIFVTCTFMNILWTIQVTVTNQSVILLYVGTKTTLHKAYLSSSMNCHAGGNFLTLQLATCAIQIACAVAYMSFWYATKTLSHNSVEQRKTWVCYWFLAEEEEPQELLSGSQKGTISQRSIVN